MKNKVAIIIPAKGNPDVTIKCLESFYEHHQDTSDLYQWTIFHADTGSSQEDLDTLINYTSQTFSDDQFKLIRYDWYNFAKINNDVVFNHVDDTFTHYMFCNNDIEFKCNLLDR